MLPLLTLGAGIAGGLIQSNAQKKASKAQIAAQQQALEAQRQAAAEARALYAPGVDAYGRALSALSDRAGIGGNALKDEGANPGTFGGGYEPPAFQTAGYAAPQSFKYGQSDFTASPAYQFQLQQGLGAIEASQAARGAYSSGATQKALMRYAQGLAAQHFDDERQFAYNQYGADRTFNRGLFETDRAHDRQSYEDERDFGRGIYRDDRDYLTGRYDRQTQDLGDIAGYGQNALNATGGAILGVGNAGAQAAYQTGEARSENALKQGGIWSGAANSAFGAVDGLWERYGPKKKPPLPKLYDI